MIRSARWLFISALLPIAACSSNASTPVAVAPAMPALAAADQSFISAAAASDAGEIQSSQLAESKARSLRVKQFAMKMVADHTQTSQQLMTIAQSKGVTADATPMPMATEMIAKLNADKPAMFDRDYLHGQVVAHTMAVKVYQEEIANGQDPDLKAFATSTLPTIKQHLAVARRMSGMRG